MPAMYPEELRRLRDLNPEVQYDFRGNIVGLTNPGSYDYQSDAWAYGPTRYDYQNSRDFVGPLMPGQQLGGLMQGADGYNYQNDQFVGPVLPGQTQGYTYSDYDQAGPLQPGVSNLSLPNVGFYSQWNPDTNSWVRHGSASDGLGMGAPRRPRRAARTGNPYAPAVSERPYSDYSRYEAYGLPYPFKHDDGSGEFIPQ